MKNKFRLKLLALKRLFASVFFLLNVIILNISCVFFVNCVNAEVIYSRSNEKQNQFFDKKIDKAFGKLKIFNEYIEPKNEFSNSKEEKVSLQDFRGQNIILYFWASWCNSCVKELEAMQRLQNELVFQSIEGIRIIPISIDYKSLLEVRKNLKGLNDLEIYRDDYKELMDAFKVKNIPTVFFINSYGYVIYKIEGHLEWDNSYMILKLKELFGVKGPIKNTSEKYQEDVNQNNFSSKQINHDSNSKEAIINRTNNKTIFIN